jgi:hypothetical protein
VGGGWKAQNEADIGTPSSIVDGELGVAKYVLDGRDGEPGARSFIAVFSDHPSAVLWSRWSDEAIESLRRSTNMVRVLINLGDQRAKLSVAELRAALSDEGTALCQVS